MKKKAYIIILFLLIFTLGGCAFQKTPAAMGYEKSSYGKIEAGAVEMDLSLDPSDNAADLSIHNTGDIEYTYDYSYDLEIWDNGWYIVPAQVSVTAELAMVLAPNSTNKEAVPLNDYFGELRKGQYRLVKRFGAPESTATAVAFFEVK